MRFIPAIALAALILSPAVADAKAAKTKEAPAKPAVEEVKATPVPVNGRFGFCVLEFAFPDQRKLTLAMSPLHQINLGVMVPNGGFTKGATYDLTYGFDGKADHKIQGRGLNDNTVLLQLEVNPPFAKALSESKTLEVGGGGQTLSFPVTPLHRATDALSKCVAENARKKPEEESLPPSLAQLLAAAGMKDAKVLSLGNMPAEKRPADFLWRTGNLVGGLLEIAAPEKETLDSLTGLFTSGLKKKCEGTFTASVGKDKTMQDLTLRPAMVSCQKKEGEGIAESLLFIFASTRHLTVFSFESDVTHQNEALAARDALQKVIESLPPEEGKPAKK
jgi:hypothetical protein